MSPINFANLIDERPDLIEVWKDLDVWLRERPEMRFIDLRRFVRTYPFLQARQVTEAFQVLIDHGFLRQVYRVETPRGDLLTTDYDTPAQIPEFVADESESRYFSADEGEVITGFKVERAGA